MRGYLIQIVSCSSVTNDNHAYVDKYQVIEAKIQEDCWLLLVVISLHYSQQQQFYMVLSIL